MKNEANLADYATPTATTPDSVAGRTYEVRTFGCQMNVHDSKRLSVKVCGLQGYGISNTVGNKVLHSNKMAAT